MENEPTQAKFNNPVTRNGYVYGLDDGILACLDLATGELRWKDGRFGHGQFILVRDLLLITAENGEVLEEAAPERLSLPREHQNAARHQRDQPH